MYKDKDKQREAVKAATRRYRGKKGDSALSSQKQGLENARGLPVVDELSDTRPVIPSKVIPKEQGSTPNFNAGEISPPSEPRDPVDRSAISKLERTAQGNIRVSKPGDDDYEPQCETNRTASQRRRDMLKGMTNQGVMDVGMTQGMTEQRTGIDSMIKSKPDLRVKRGKDIKCFEDLPPDVQQTIDVMSVVEGKIDQTIKANRTAIAVHYQHVFPERY